MSNARAVAARLYVAHTGRNAYTPGQQSAVVKMNAVTRGEHNKNWAKWTPNANAELSFSQPDYDACVFFTSRLGEELAVLFAEDPAPLPAGGVQVALRVGGYEASAGDASAVTVKLHTTAAYGNAEGLPVGQITMTIANPGAADFFVERLGKAITAQFVSADD